jgi:hypothetical protein
MAKDVCDAADVHRHEPIELIGWDFPSSAGVFISAALLISGRVDLRRGPRAHRATAVSSDTSTTSKLCGAASGCELVDSAFQRAAAQTVCRAINSPAIAAQAPSDAGQYDSLARRHDTIISASASQQRRAASCIGERGGVVCNDGAA